MLNLWRLKAAAGESIAADYANRRLDHFELLSTENCYRNINSEFRTINYFIVEITD